MEIPYQRLSEQVLRSIVEEFVNREGTDYGEHTFTLSEKVAQVMLQLERGTAIVVYAEDTETVTILPNVPVTGTDR